MTSTVSTVDVETFRREVLDAGLLVAEAVDGLYGRSDTYERVVAGFEDYAGRLGADQDAQHVSFPPVLPREVFERTGYLSSFPNLMGSVHSFDGDDQQHAELLDMAEKGKPWAWSLEPTDAMLCSSACHPVYPTCRGTLPAGGRRFRVSSWCFRHEPSRDLTRMQAFRMFEHVYVGDPDEASAARRLWVERGHAALVALGLGVETVPANDPFFGRAGRFLARAQRDDELKLELVVPFHTDRPDVAVGSSNLHRDHFGRSFGITTASGEVAHSTCFGFGVDRVVLALFRHHGLDPDRWPASVRALLWP